jgi:hypothetical protein
MPLDLDPKLLAPFAVPVFALVVKRYGPTILSRLERRFKRKPLSRAERRRREKAKRKRNGRR